ncbi:hypothetical protein HanXRQr2_Chr13g0573521 [Helianthus annuus]|uniref:Uncharacterized protein n=1 Tax=Helianthus annuus TaxID=4232 RepID=A0A251SNS9_HELAN|nr:UPF0481 protein At3g47200 [Helianthus annuus]KAF5772156.1 hypothetical protein HanXRQr2_Chr13g0573521 [Helianthus annuus]KAJ0496608.1 hypothetical protein HanHA89_Chr13g0501781 [Helianthus annuus]
MSGTVVKDKDSNEDWLRSLLNAESPPSHTTRIPRVPKILKKHTDRDKCYVPEVVSLGPYHHGKPNLESVESFKPLYPNKLVKGNHESIRSLFHSLLKMVPTLRGYYEDDVDHLSDDAFVRMMLLDGCFILYFIEQIFKSDTDETDTLGLKSHQIMFIQQDMLLLENQIPYQVLTEVMKFLPAKWDSNIKRFIDDNIIAPEKCRKSGKNVSKPQVDDPIPDTTSHLLELLQTRITKEKSRGTLPKDRYTFRNAKELIEVGIHFKSSQTRSLGYINFSSCGFFANLELPPITVDDSTKHMLLNLVAYEMCSNDTNGSWVTSYICLLDSLMDHAEDVKVLRKAGVLENQLGSDEEVAQLFNEIGRDLVPYSFAYSDVATKIQKHYDSKTNTWISQLKREYIKSPWAFVALFAGLLGLFLSGVQTYFSVFGIQSHCDSFCLYLKKHHHLP